MQNDLDRLMKKKELEILLQKIPKHQKPKAELEQYFTPAVVASDILYTAHSFGDVADKKIVDLGCGTGIFAIGAKLLGAEEAVGVDIDGDALSIARDYADKLDLDIQFINCEIKDFFEKADVVMQNPPFGAQRKHADIPFVKKAIEIAPIVYSLHLAKTSAFITKLINKSDAHITYTKKYKWEIRHTFAFHRKEKEVIEVTLFRIKSLK